MQKIVQYLLGYFKSSDIWTHYKTLQVNMGKANRCHYDASLGLGEAIYSVY